MCGIFLALLCSPSLDLKEIKEHNEKFVESSENEAENLEEKKCNMDEQEVSTFPSDLFNINDNISLGQIVSRISKRGPDHLGLIELLFDSFALKYDSNPKIIELDVNQLLKKDINLYDHFASRKDLFSVLALSSVLSLRGVDSITNQPLIDHKTSNILQYNGEIFKVKNNVQFRQLNFANLLNFDLLYKNDGIQLKYFLDEISLMFFKTHTAKLLEEGTIYQSKSKLNLLYCEWFNEIFNSLESDHALVYYDNLNKKILLSRDIFGKRSLLLIKAKELLMILSALPEQLYEMREKIEIWEVPANSVLVYDLTNTHDGNPLTFYKNPYIEKPSLLRFPSYKLMAETSDDLNAIIKDCYLTLKSAVAKRIVNLPKLVKKDEMSIAVMFSGGIDSLVLAYFVAEIIGESPNVTIDLINLSFSKDAPDRQTGILAYYELLKLFPKTKINLIICDKSYDKDVTTQRELVKSLTYPRETHMDFNIATALKLASQAKGLVINRKKLISFMDEYFEIINKKLLSQNANVLNSNTNNYCNEILSKKLEKIDYLPFLQDEIYTSNSKIILSGLGADELFGGYARYRTPFLKDGLTGLSLEMGKDIDRIWFRNFGRDDRVCSDNGIELRFPFLDLDLIDFLSKTNQSAIANFNLNRGQGEKLLLRNVVKLVGFKISHLFEKRAIQFGTRLAKETNIKQYGSNRKANGKAQFK